MNQGRHLPWHVFQENYLDPDVPALLSVPGSPSLHITFDPQTGILALVADIRATSPPVIDRRNIFSDLCVFDGKTMPRVYVRAEALFREFYAICTEVADRCQLGGESLDAAITETVEAFDLLLRSAVALQSSTEIGLVGELLILGSLLRTNGPAALAGWRGAHRDKHDFRLGLEEIETKTVTGDRRQHWIHGVSQLEPSDSCKLTLLSIQLARTAGKGTLDLQTLVKHIREELRPSPQLGIHFESMLNKVVNEEALRLADSQFNFRSEILAFRVDDSFPKLSTKALRTAIGDHMTYIRDVHYQLGLDGISASADSQLCSAVLEDIHNTYA